MELELERIRPGGNSDFAENPDHEPDLLPEYYHYQDEGCEFADSCLDCPFAKCIYDKPRGKQHFVKTLRNKELLRLFTEGKEIKEMAVMFGISQRTVQRALKRARNE